MRRLRTCPVTLPSLRVRRTVEWPHRLVLTLRVVTSRVDEDPQNWATESAYRNAHAADGYVGERRLDQERSRRSYISRDARPMALAASSPPALSVSTTAT